MLNVTRCQIQRQIEFYGETGFQFLFNELEFERLLPGIVQSVRKKLNCDSALKMDNSKYVPLHQVYLCPENRARSVGLFGLPLEPLGHLVMQDQTNSDCVRVRKLLQGFCEIT
jgi:hypothetical protein